MIFANWARQNWKVAFVFIFQVAKIGSLVFKTEKNFQILAGSASFMYPAMAVGMGNVSFLLIKLVFTHFV